MNNAHIDLVWKDYPNQTTPVDEKNLNDMVRSINLLNENTNDLDTTKATKAEIASLVKDIDFDEDTGIFTITRKDSSEYPIKTIDTKLEKLAKNWTYDEKTQKITIELEDGTLRHIDLSSLIAVFEFIDSDTISFYTEYSGDIIYRFHWAGRDSLIISDAYLDSEKISELVCESDLRISEVSAYAHKTGSPPYILNVAIEQGGKRCYIKTEKGYDRIRIEVKTNDDATENPLAEFIIKTKGNENITAIVKEGSIQEKHLQPNYLADIRMEASKVESSRSSAERSAKEAESFTHGGTGIREGEDTDNAEFYKNQARSYSESINIDSLAKKDGSNLSIPTTPATNDESTAPGAFTFDSFFESEGGIKLLKDVRTFLGTFAIGGKWSSVISVRHRNGFGDGASFGMYLRSKLTETGNLSWGKQIGRYSWQDERVILDSENYPGYALPLSGGTISGTIVSSVPPQTALDTLKGKAIINSIASGKTKGFVGLAKMNSTNGVFAQGVLDGAYIFGFAEDSTIAGNQSTMKYGVILLNEVGNSSFPGRVTASSFKGDVEGNATSATKASQDGDGNVIKNTYAKKSIYGDRSINMGGYVSETYGCSLGSQNDALGEYSSVLGGNLNRAKVSNSAVLCGEENDASGICSSVLGGAGNTSSNYGASVMGKYNKNMAGGAHINTQSGDVFVIGNGTGGSSRSNALRVTYSGNIYGTKAFQSSGADYAEFKKEWADGNPDNEDRVGYLVTIKNGLLYKANEGDYIVGITSGNPSVVGNADEDYYWKYERDEFNRIVMEDAPEIVQKRDEDGNLLFDEETHEPMMEETGKIIKNARMKLAEDYDSSLQKNYIERKDRKEWDYVGQVGTLPVRDDGTCLPDHFCKCGKDGVATFAETRWFDTFYVTERISDNVVSVEMRG